MSPNTILIYLVCTSDWDCPEQKPKCDTTDGTCHKEEGKHLYYTYSVSGLSCPEAEAYLTVIFHSFLHNNNINSDYILGAIIYFTPHGNCSSYF